MAQDKSYLQMTLGRHFRSLVFTGFLVGTLDGLAAVVNFFIGGGKDPLRVFLFIASGVFGREAVAANANLAWWGLLFHYFIAFCWTTLFFLLYPKLKFLSGRKYLAGIAYGIVVWMVMTMVVIPLSNVQQLPFTLSRVIVGVSILMVFVGLPISFFAHRSYSRIKTEIPE